MVVTDTMNSDEPGELADTGNHDSAAKLLSIIRKMIDAQAQRFGNSGNTVGKVVLHEAFEQIADAADFPSYVDLLSRFMLLAEGVKKEVQLLVLSKESVREAWLDQIEHITAVFNSSNFSERTDAVFKRHFSPTNLAVLDTISERFLNDNVSNSTVDQLEDAFQAVSEAFSEYSKSDNLSPKMRQLFTYYIDHLENIKNNYENFSEEEFWNYYKIIFSSFMQIHDDIIDEKNKNSINEKLRNVLNKMILPTSLSANAITIAGATIPLLTG